MLVHVLPLIINPIIFIIILSTIILGTIIVIISSCWLLMWIGFENQVQFLVGELKSYKPHSMALKKKKKKRIWVPVLKEHSLKYHQEAELLLSVIRGSYLALGELHICNLWANLSSTLFSIVNHNLQLLPSRREAVIIIIICNPYFLQLELFKVGLKHAAVVV